MKLIALEEHFLTPMVREAWSHLDPADQDRTHILLNTPEVEARLDDFAELRIQQMDKSGVDVQVLSLTSPGVQSLDREPAIELARQTNDLIAETVRRNPDRFEGLAALPTPARKAAAQELDRAVTQLGCKGAILHGRKSG